jgi:Na+/proline symporter
VVQRYVTTPTENAARRSLWLTMWMAVFCSAVFFALGVALYAFYKNQPALLDPGLANNDGILPFFIMQQIPVGLAGFVIAAIFAAAQSTISSSLNSVATAYVTDFHARVLRPGNSDHANLQVARIIVVAVGVAGVVLACVMARSDIQSMFAVFNSLIGLTAGPLGGLFALGIFNPRASGRGALLGALCGFLAVLGLFVSKAPVFSLLYALIGFMTCFVVGSLHGALWPRTAGKT